jgi:hypothetical protein
MNNDDNKRRILEEDEFVFSKRHNYSMTELENRYPEGCPDNVIASVLLMTEEEVVEAYQQLVLRYRSLMGVKL